MSTEPPKITKFIFAVKSNPVRLSLILLISIILASHFLYVYKTYQYPTWDEWVYIKYAVDFIPILKHPSLHVWLDILNIVKDRQPLYSIFIAVPGLFLGTEQIYKIALVINGLFYALTILSTYLLAKRFLNKKISFVASLIFAFYGFPLFYIHFSLSETVTTSFVALALLFLARSKNLTIFKETTFFSISTLLVTLTRWESLIFILGPFILSLAILFGNRFIKKTVTNQKIFKTLLILILLGLLPALALYYLPNLTYFKGYISSNEQYGAYWTSIIFGHGYTNVFSVHSIMFYSNILSQQTIFFWLLFVIGFLISVRYFKKYSFLSLALIVPYAILTFSTPWKGDRFIVPIYPTMAILSAVTFEHIRAKSFRTILIILTIVIGFLNFLGASWGLGPMGQQGLKDVVLPNFIPHPRRIYLTPIVWPPRPDEGNGPLILSTIIKDSTENNLKKPNVFLTFNFAQIENPLGYVYTFANPNLFQYYGLVSVYSYKDLFSRINNADYILVKTGRFLDDPSNQDRRFRLIRVVHSVFSKNRYKLPRAFVAINSITVPIDKSNLIIYKKVYKITSLEWNSLADEFTNVDPARAAEIKKSEALFITK